MTTNTPECGPMCTHLWNFFAGDFFLGLLVALLSGWGAVVIAERWASKRERAAQERASHEANVSRLMDHVTELVKWYQVNVRLLRQDPADRSVSELNLAHATFIAQIKLLAIEPSLEDDAKTLLNISRAMAQLWPVDLQKPSRDAGLQAIYGDFEKAMNEIVGHIRELNSAN